MLDEQSQQQEEAVNAVSTDQMFCLQVNDIGHANHKSNNSASIYLAFNKEIGYLGVDGH